MKVHSMLPVVSPAQAIQISPEALEIANSYLQCQNIQQTANDLGLSTEIVTETLDRREVKSYIDTIFMDVGFNNRFLMRNVMDTIIRKKLQELDEAEVGSSKDIADLLALSHSMTMKQLELQIKLETLRQSNTKVNTQVNMQINDMGNDGTKYGSLISKLLESAK